MACWVAYDGREKLLWHSLLGHKICVLEGSTAYTAYTWLAPINTTLILSVVIDKFTSKKKKRVQGRCLASLTDVQAGTCMVCCNALIANTRKPSSATEMRSSGTRWDYSFLFLLSHPLPFCLPYTLKLKPSFFGLYISLVVVPISEAACSYKLLVILFFCALFFSLSLALALYHYLRTLVSETFILTTVASVRVTPHMMIILDQINLWRNNLSTNSDVVDFDKFH